MVSHCFASVKGLLAVVGLHRTGSKPSVPSGCERWCAPGWPGAGARAAVAIIGDDGDTLVLIDSDPSSATYRRIVATIAMPSLEEGPRPGVAASGTERRYVAITHNMGSVRRPRGVGRDRGRRDRRCCAVKSGSSTLTLSAEVRPTDDVPQ